MSSSWNINLFVTSTVLLVEILFGVGFLGILGIPVSVALMLAFLSNRSAFPRALGIAALYAGLGLTTLAVINANWRIAEHKAKPIIVACEGFHAKYQRYPQKLDELVPEFLPSIPRAKYTLAARDFGYDNAGPSLYFLVAFHGVASYDFQTRTWRTNE